MMNDKEVFTRFAKQLADWSRTGEEPELGDYNVRAYLDAQEKRLKNKGIIRNFEFYPESNVHKVSDFMVGILLNGYNRRVNYALGRKKVTYSKNNKVLFKEQLKATMYQLIKWPSKENHEWKKDTYVCPGCGHIEQIEKLEEKGCEYCGAKFLVSQLYPKVTNFYLLENAAPSSPGFAKVIRLLIGSPVYALVFTIFMLLSAPDIVQEYSISYMYQTLCVGFAVLNLIFAPIILQIKDAMQVSVGVAGAKSKITSRLKKYDETFSYDYFEGKALSLLRWITFAENPLECIQYEGEGVDVNLQNILDMEYRGGIDVKKIDVTEEYLSITLKVFMKNTYYKSGKCRSKNDTMYLQMKHKKSFRVLPEFSIVKVMCHGCGGSFDATKHRNCPYCDRKYDAGIDDWIVTGIRIL